MAAAPTIVPAATPAPIKASLESAIPSYRSIYYIIVGYVVNTLFYFKGLSEIVIPIA